MTEGGKEKDYNFVIHCYVRRGMTPTEKSECKKECVYNDNVYTVKKILANQRLFVPVPSEEF